MSDSVKADNETRKDRPQLIAPFGGRLVERFVAEDDLEARVAEAGDCRLALTHDDLIHLYNLTSGCYSPLTGFMTEAEHTAVIRDRRLPHGVAWTIPVLLHAAGFAAADLVSRKSMALLDGKGRAMAVLDIESVFEIDPESHCGGVYGTASVEHPGVQDTMGKPALCVGGTVHVGAERLEIFRHLKTPAQSRTWLESRGAMSVAGFSTRNICHIGHEHLHELALERSDLLGIAVITGAQVKGNFLPDVVFDTYEYLIENHYPKDSVFLLNLRLPPIYAGPNEAFLQATIMQNLGFTHFIVGRDHAGIGDYYPKYSSQKIFQELEDLAIEILAIPEPLYSVKTGTVITVVGPDENEADFRPLNGRDVRLYLLEKRYKELAVILRPELQILLTRMFEEKPEPGTDQTHMRETRRIFYD